jgi:hypothetical protein
LVPGPPSGGDSGWDHPPHGAKKEMANKRLKKANNLLNLIFNTPFIFNISLGNAYFKEFEYGILIVPKSSFLLSWLPQRLL